MCPQHIVLLDQEGQLQIRQQQRHFNQDALQRTIGDRFSQQTASKIQADEDAIVLFMAMDYLGTPGQFRQFQTYLTRADLPLNPMAHSPWAYLWQSRSDWAFITTMGIDVRTFDDLLDRFADRWNYSTIERGDVNPNGEPQPGCRSLDAAGALGLVLHWLCSTMSSYSLQQLFGITPAVCSCYLSSGMHHLLEVLKQHPQARFLWPTTEEKAARYSRPMW
ncbi:hypothetical protein PGT21_032783 [Puccinia graminis f. sp. tritici]|uniref:Uncharacterized protein n=1 Tax=Puccinia graminis f. sp. tritici TaxID=56615 RepID=A0A5B0M0A7_PUCGR|nr:hypothetical protein PGT21_032783 [Puccinia graminis f. sp. tritici]